VSALEEAMAFQIRALSLPAPVREHRFHPTRQWRLDFAWPDRKVAVECEGGVWIRGRHSRGKGFIEDCSKYAEAALAGWLVFRVTAEHIKSGEAIRWLEQAMRAKAAA
jgi:very-short-patch-repair endonuclease